MRQSNARGVTLVELLVVITLILIVTASAIPVVAPAIQQRRVREATRLVSSYLAAARSRAMETGRPVGVMIERFTPGLASSSNVALGAPQNFSMNLSVAESPPPYCGDFVGSTATVTLTPNPNPPSSWPVPINATHQVYVSQLAVFINQADAWSSQNIRVGDAIRFNYQGPLYYFDSYNANNNGYITLPPPVVPTGSGSPPQGWTVGLVPDHNIGVQTIYPSPAVQTGTSVVPYQIFRQPVRSAAGPLQLPEGIVIDLNLSGMSTEANSVFTGLANPIISFAPNGSVQMLYDNGAQPPTGPIYLLLGRREQIPLPTVTWPSGSTVEANLTDLNSFWVAIGYQSGQVTVNENTLNSYNASGTAVTNSGQSYADVVTARGLASGASGGVITTTGGR